MPLLLNAKGAGHDQPQRCTVYLIRVYFAKSLASRGAMGEWLERFDYDDKDRGFQSILGRLGTEKAPSVNSAVNGYLF